MSCLRLQIIPRETNCGELSAGPGRAIPPWRHLFPGNFRIIHPFKINLRLYFSGYPLVFLLAFLVRPRGAVLQALLHQPIWAIPVCFAFWTLSFKLALVLF